MIENNIDVVNSEGVKVGEVRACACSKEVENKMRKLGISDYSYEFGSYETDNGDKRWCWKPVRKSLATLISITHNL